MAAEPVSHRRSRTARQLVFVLAGALLGVAAVQAGKVWYYSRPVAPMAGKPLEFPAGGVWLNGGSPEFMRGKVAFVQLSFIGCGACRLMDPSLKRWHEQFAAEGFTVVEVDEGNSDTLEEVRAWIDRDKLIYPVYYDTAGAMCRSLGVHGFPTMFLVGRDGKVLWQTRGWSGEAGLREIERQIRGALAGK